MEFERADLRSPAPTGPRRTRWGLFATGAIGGLVISLAYYLALGNEIVPQTPLSFFGAVLFKAAAGVAMIVSPRWRPLGLGLLASIPLAIWIFVALCFGALTFS